MSIILNSLYIIQHNFDKARGFKGVLNAGVGVDLIIVDIPEGLLVPIVSSPTTSVSKWNKLGDGFLQMVFNFASSLVHDIEVLLLFHSFVDFW
jgi:hypothetical protein